MKQGWRSASIQSTINGLNQVPNLHFVFIFHIFIFFMFHLDLHHSKEETTCCYFHYIPTLSGSRWKDSDMTGWLNSKRQYEEEWRCIWLSGWRDFPLYPLCAGRLAFHFFEPCGDQVEIGCHVAIHSHTHTQALTRPATRTLPRGQLRRHRESVWLSHCRTKIQGARLDPHLGGGDG